MMFQGRVLYFLLLCVSPEVWSQTSDHALGKASAAGVQSVGSQGVGSQSVNVASYAGQVILGLLFVVLMIFLIAWFLRKFGQGSLMGNQHMKVVSSLALGPRDRLVVVEVGGEQLLLGISPGRITTLHTFTSPVISTSENRELSEFGQKIRDIISRGSIKPE